MIDRTEKPKITVQKPNKSKPLFTIGPNNTPFRISRPLPQAEPKQPALVSRPLPQAGLEQITEEERAVYARIIAREESITKDVREIVTEQGGSLAGLENRLKSIESVHEKLKFRLSRLSMEDLNDIIRYTAVFPPENMVERGQAVLGQLQQRGYTLVSIANSWMNANNPYKGVNTYLNSPDGQPFELQFHTQESFEVKNGAQHDLYVESRKYSKDSPQAIELMRKMSILSDGLRRPNRIDEWSSFRNI